MADLPALPGDSENFGPAMRALKPIQQRFVVNLAAQVERNHTKALTDAGWVGTHGSAKVQAFRWAHDQRVIAALREVCQNNLSAAMAQAVNALEAMILNPQHKDHARAVLGLLDRVGLNAVTETKVTHEHKMSDPVLVAGIRAMAAKLGIDPAKLLGGKPLPAPAPVEATDAEFVEVPPELAELADVL